MHIDKSVSIWKILKKYALRHKVAFFFMFFVVTIGALADLMENYVFKLIVDKVSEGAGSYDADIFWIVALLFFIFVIVNVTFRISGFIGIKIFPKIRTEFRLDLFQYLRSHSQRFFSDNFAGTLASKVNQAGRALDSLYGDILWNFYNAAFFALSSFVLLATVNLKVSLIEIALLSIYFVVVTRFIKRGVHRHKEYADARAVTTGQLVDTIGNMMSVINYAAGKREQDFVRDVCLKENARHRRSWTYQEWIRFGNQFTASLVVIIMTVLGIFLWKDGMASVGDVVMIFTLTNALAGTVRQISHSMIGVSEYVGDIRDALDVIGVKHEVVDVADAKELKNVKGNIGFKDLKFSYPNTNEDLFSDLNISIPQGQKVALIGASGSGKSTFVKMLLRMYDPQSGSICIDGHDIKEVKQDSLRYNIGIVSQEVDLFHRTLFENIAYGKPDASEKEIRRAAEMAHAHDFIVSLPQGYKTLVGERGVKLSGGQRQRVAIARAILKDAPILVFDEATSSLDSESEHLIQKALDPLMRGKTVVAIAHRLSTIKHFDRILVFSNGKVVEDGTHKKLIQKDGEYAHLWKRQSGGFLPEEDTSQDMSETHS